MIVPLSTSLLFGDGVYVGRNVELGPQAQIEIGDFTSIQDRCLLIGDVSVGRYCAFSLNVLITSGRHHYDLYPHWLIKDQDKHALSTTDAAAAHSRRVRIEDDCWLGVNSVVSPGVTVGKGCVVGANAVVTEDLPPYSVAAGIPARIIKNRLKFVPPRIIDWNAEADLPYFYSGFRVSQTERHANRYGPGLACYRQFSVALSSTPGGNIGLIARALDGETCSVRFGEQVRKLGPEFQGIEFPVAEGATWKFDFTVEGTNRKWPISIKKAWAD